MHRLHLLGGAWLERGEERLSGAAAQRHRIALLARLAAEPDLTLSREVLAGLLWPERGPKEARHLLNVSVHALRKELGEDALESMGRDLRLDLDYVSCDLVEFREALERDDPDDALALYRGPFLDGFFLDDAPEFQHWQDLERARVSREFGEALKSTAEAAEARGDPESARERWRTLVEHEPHSAEATLGLMRTLEATGKRAGALAAAAAHVALMAEEFGAEPNPEVVELAERMRARPEPGSLPRVEESATRSGDGGTTDTAPAHPSRSRIAWLSLAAVVLVASLAIVANEGAPSAGESDSPPFASVAVLPFDDFSEEADQTYLANGIAEEVLNALAGIEGLFVPARSSSFRFRNPGVDLADAARQLNVAHVLEGSIRRDGERLRVTAQLIDARTGYHLWSEQFDRTASDLLDVQEEIARAIASELRGELERRGAPLTAHAGADREAYDHYLRGRHAWNRRTPDGMQEALDAFERAIELDPDYAAAWAGIASVWMLMPDHGGLPTREGLSRAKTAARRAVALAPDYAPAHATLGHVLDDLDRNRVAAGEAFRRAIELDPGYATAHQWYGLHLANGGHFDEALAAVGEARRLDPLSSIINTAVGAVRYFARDWEGAAAEYEAVIRADPDFAVAWALLGRVHLVTGRPDEAVTALRNAVELSEGDASYRAVLAAALASQGERTEARALVDALLSVPEGAYIPYVELAPALMTLGDVEEAMSLYERGWEELDTATKHLYAEPLHDPARGHPRFDALVARLGLPEG